MGKSAKIVEQELYVPERVFAVYSGNDTAERYKKMEDLLAKRRAAQFWGVDSEWAQFNGHRVNMVVPYSSNPLNRIVQVKYLLRKIPDLDPYSSGLAHVTPADKVIAQFKKLRDSKVPDYSSRKRNARLPLTYAEAHHEPTIRINAMTTLIEEGDPVTVVIRGLGNWVKEHRDEIPITDIQLSQGYQTFDTLLLASRDAPSVRAIGVAATEFINHS